MLNQLNMKEKIALLELGASFVIVLGVIGLIVGYAYPWMDDNLQEFNPHICVMKMKAQEQQSNLAKVEQQ